MTKPKSKLNAKQLKFTELYLRDFDAQKAYAGAGYDATNAYTAAFEMLRHPSIRKMIDEEHTKRRAEYRDIHADMINRLRQIIEADVDDFAIWDENKTKLIPSDQIPKYKKKAIVEINSFVTTRQTKKDGTVTSSSIKVANKLKLVDKIKAMELLAKLTGALEADKEDAGANATKNVIVFNLPEGTKLDSEYDKPSKPG